MGEDSDSDMEDIPNDSPSDGKKGEIIIETANE